MNEHEVAPAGVQPAPAPVLKRLLEKFLPRSSNDLEPALVGSWRRTVRSPLQRVESLLLLGLLSIAGVLVLIVYLRAVELVTPPPGYSSAFNLLVIAMAAFVVGMLAGFVTSATAEEKSTFSNLTTVVNGILGGFALSDLTKADGAIRTILRSLGGATTSPPAFIGSVVALCGSLGFLFMYVNKQYLLNPALSLQQVAVEKNARIGALTRGIKISLVEIGQTPQIDDATRGRIASALAEFERAVENDDKLLDLFTIDGLHSYAKAYYSIGNFSRAEAMLRRARNLAPDHPETLFYLAHVLLAANRPREAVPYLMQLQAAPNTPVLTWKLLGYACLWDDDLLAEAERASLKYLAVQPHDVGARLNLLCVYGQQPPGDSTRQKLLPALSQLVESSGRAAELFVAVTARTPDENDFFLWRDDPEFKRIVDRAHAIVTAGKPS